MNEYYRRCSNDWGNVGIALEIARTLGRRIKDVCDYYNRYRRHGWARVLIEIGIRPDSRYYDPFYERLHYHGDCWHDRYTSYCEVHHYHHYDRPYKKHKKHYKHYKRRYRDYDDDDDDD